GVDDNLHVAPPRDGVDLGGIDLDLDLTRGNDELLVDARVAVEPLLDALALAVADLADQLITDAPATDFIEDVASFGERVVAGNEADDTASLFAEKAVEAKDVVERVAAQSAVGAGEIDAGQRDETDRGHHLAAVSALVAASMAASTATGGSPFFSPSWVCCCRAAGRVSRRNERPRPRTTPSQQSRVWPGGAERAVCSNC